MIIPAILLTDNCSIKRYKGPTPLGDDYLDSEPYDQKCRFEPKRKKILTPEGEEFITSGFFYLLPTEKNKQIKPSSVMYFNGNEMLVEAVEIMKGFSDSHVVVIV